LQSVTIFSQPGAWATPAPLVTKVPRSAEITAGEKRSRSELLVTAILVGRDERIRRVFFQCPL
jgi:hypothetical protein